MWSTLNSWPSKLKNNLATDPQVFPLEHSSRKSPAFQRAPETPCPAGHPGRGQMKNKTWSRYKYLLASAPRLSTRLGHVGGLFSFRRVSVQFARRAPSVAASNTRPGVDTDPGRGVLAARKKTVGWRTPILACNTLGRRPESMAPSP